MATEPLKITAHLVDGRINSKDGLLSLDSILYYAWFRRWHPEKLLGTLKLDDLLIGLPLPKDQHGLYQASVGFYHQYTQTTEYWNREPNWERGYPYLAKTTGKINPSVGVQRAYHTAETIRVISDPVFYCRGKIKKISYYLSLVKAIGKKSSAGWGRVKSWSVEPVADDWSLWSPKYGLMRPWPTKYQSELGHDLTSYFVDQTAIRPPGWRYRNQALCYIPGFIH